MAIMNTPFCSIHNKKMKWNVLFGLGLKDAKEWLCEECDSPKRELPPTRWPEGAEL